MGWLNASQLLSLPNGYLCLIRLDSGVNPESGPVQFGPSYRYSASNRMTFGLLTVRSQTVQPCWS